MTWQHSYHRICFLRYSEHGFRAGFHAPRARSPDPGSALHDTTTSAPDRPCHTALPGHAFREPARNDSEKSGIEFSFRCSDTPSRSSFVQESYADGNLAVTAYLSDPTDESFGQPWSSVTVNFGSPLQQDATVFPTTPITWEKRCLENLPVRAFTGQFMRSGFCSLPGLHLRYRSHGQHARLKRVRIGRPQQPCRDAGRVPRGTRKRIRQRGSQMPWKAVTT